MHKAIPRKIRLRREDRHFQGDLRQMFHEDASIGKRMVPTSKRPILMMRDSKTPPIINHHDGERRAGYIDRDERRREVPRKAKQLPLMEYWMDS